MQIFKKEKPGQKPLTDAREYIRKNGGICIGNIEAPHYHSFIVFKSWDLFFKNRDKFKIDGRTYFTEILLADRPVKPYLDIEFLLKDKDEYDGLINDFVLNLKKDIITVFKNTYNEEVKDNEIYISNGSRKSDDRYKLSLHVTISTASKVAYSNCYNEFSDSYAGDLAIRLKELNDKYKNIHQIDMAVYSRYREMRIAGSCKFDFNQKKFSRIPLKFDGDMANFIISNIDNTEDIKLLKTVPLRESIMRKEFNAAEFESLKKDDRLTALIQKFIPSAYCTGVVGKNYQFQYNHNVKCICCDIKHDHVGCFVYPTANYGWMMKCHSSNPNKKRINLGILDLDESWKHNEIEIDQHYIISNKGTSLTERDEKSKDVIMDFIENDTKTMIVRSPMDTGKTTMLEEIIKLNKSKGTPLFKRILWLTYRQTLTNNIIGKFRKLGFVSYLDENNDKKLYEYDRVILQLDSINKIINDEMIIPKYDLIIIDEIDSFLNHFNSPFLGRNKHAIISGARNFYKTIKLLMEQATKNIVLDADYGTRASILVNDVGSSVLLNNIYQVPKKIFKIYEDIEEVKRQRSDDLLKGLNVVTITMSKAMGDELKANDSIIGIDTLYYNSKADDSMKLDLMNVDEKWKVQSLMYTSMIEAGVDFNHDHFDRMYIFLCARTVSPRALFQMTGRIRKIRSNIVNCAIGSKMSKELNNRVYSYEDTFRNYKYIEKLSDYKLFEMGPVKTEKGIEFKLGEISSFDYITIINATEYANTSPSIFMTEFIGFINKKNHKFELILKTEKRTGAKEPKEDTGKMKIANEWVGVNYGEYDLIETLNKEKTNTATKIDKVIIGRYYFCKRFKLHQCIDFAKLDDAEATDEKVEDYQNLFRNFIMDCHGDNYEQKIRNIEHLINPNKEVRDSDDFKEYKDATRKGRADIFKNTINFFTNDKNISIDNLNGFEVNAFEIDERINKWRARSKFIKNETENRKLFGIKKKTDTKYDEKTQGEVREASVKLINQIVSHFGFCFRRGKRVKQSGKEYHSYIFKINDLDYSISKYRLGMDTYINGYKEISKKECVIDIDNIVFEEDVVLLNGGKIYKEDNE